MRRFDTITTVLYDANKRTFVVGPIGVPELIFLFVLALLIFGPRKLPELGRSLGKALTEFRRASSELRMTVEEEMRELERQSSELAATARDAIAPLEEPVASSCLPAEPPPETPATLAGEEKSTDGQPKPA